MPAAPPLHVFSTIQADAVGRKWQAAMIWTEPVADNRAWPSPFAKHLTCRQTVTSAAEFVCRCALHSLGERRICRARPGPFPAQRAGIRHPQSGPAIARREKMWSPCWWWEISPAARSCATRPDSRPRCKRMARPSGRRMPVGGGATKRGSARSLRRGQIWATPKLMPAWRTATGRSRITMTPRGNPPRRLTAAPGAR